MVHIVVVSLVLLHRALTFNCHFFAWHTVMQRKKTKKIKVRMWIHFLQRIFLPENRCKRAQKVQKHFRCWFHSNSMDGFAPSLPPFYCFSPLLHRLCSRSDDEQDIIDGGGFISPRFYSRMELEELMCCCYCWINSADLLILSSSSTQTHTYTQTRKHSLITSTVHKAADLNIAPRYCSKMQHQIL